MKHPSLPNRNDLILLGILFALAAAACTVVLLVPPGSKYAGWLPECKFHELTGLYCPGCGSTRALFSLLHGDLMSSLHNNLLLIPCGLTVVLLIVKKDLSPNRYTAIVIVAVLVVFMILRNIPCMPFTLLAPIPLP